MKRRNNDKNNKISEGEDNIFGGWRQWQTRNQKKNNKKLLPQKKLPFLSLGMFPKKKRI